MSEPEKPKSEERVNLGEGEAILLDALGARVIWLQPSDEVALMLDLEGRLNKSPERDVARYLMTVDQAAELVAALVVATHRTMQGDMPLGQKFGEQFEQALRREQLRLADNEEETDDQL